MASQPEDRHVPYTPKVAPEDMPRDREPQVGAMDAREDGVTRNDGTAPAGDRPLEMSRPALPLTAIIVLAALAVTLGVVIVMFFV